MAQVTGGKFFFSRSIKPADYESKKAECEISFAVYDNEDYLEMLGLCRRTAMQYVLEAVGLVKQGDKETIAVAAAETAAAKAAATVTTEKKRRTRTPDAPAGPTGAPDPAAVADNIHTGEERKDPSDINVTTQGEEWGAAKRDITDEELGKACGVKNAEFIEKTKMPGAPKIRELIAEFVKHPGGLKDIPQPERPKFLEKLKALAVG